MSGDAKVNTTRYDVCFTEHGPKIEHHFCREWDESGGCYGTNPEHGLSWGEARAEVVAWHKAQAEWWEKRTEAEEFPPLDAPADTDDSFEALAGYADDAASNRVIHQPTE